MNVMTVYSLIKVIHEDKENPKTNVLSNIFPSLCFLKLDRHRYWQLSKEMISFTRLSTDTLQHWQLWLFAVCFFKSKSMKDCINSCDWFLTLVLSRCIQSGLVFLSTQKRRQHLCFRMFIRRTLLALYARRTSFITNPPAGIHCWDRSMRLHKVAQGLVQKTDMFRQ